ncbi:MAG: hypothetical protein QXU97_04735 [Fervidicoccaceae archaeon]
MPSLDEWDERKRKSLERIAEDSEVGYLDERVTPLLRKINERPGLYTTSSCSGRVVVIDAPAPWVRGEGGVVFKKHDELEVEELRRLLATEPAHIYWLNAAGPIIHVMARSLEDARDLLEAARRAGFKHSGIVSVSKRGFLVELVCSAQMIVPVKSKGKALVYEERLGELVELVNSTLREGWRRLNALLEELERSPAGRRDAD